MKIKVEDNSEVQTVKIRKEKTIEELTAGMFGFKNYGGKDEN